MKRIVFMILFIINVMIGHAQHYENVSIDELINTDEVIYCIDDSLLGIIIYCEPVFDSTMWHVTDYYGTVVVDIQDVDSIVLYNTGEAKIYYLDFSAYIPDYGWMSILQDKYISVRKTSTTNNPFEEPTIWKHRNETAILNGNPIAPWNPYTYLWSTGEITETIEITEPGIYSVTLTDLCGSATYSVEVRDNVELYRATVDLRTNKNKVTWLATPEQAEYITSVKVYRDGNLVGTAPYANGYFLDAIGSDAAARTYQIVGVSVEGDDCPIASYQKGTIHTTYYLDVNNDLNMTWNIPYVEEGAQGTLTYFQVCKYDPVTGQLIVVDQVNSLITDYTCGVNQFEGDYPVIAAVFSNGRGREFEDLSFSNMYTDIASQPLEITIYLEPGWTWISYPYAVTMNIASALGDFVPMEGDIIKSQIGVSSYRNGQWRGSFQQLIPGFGYKYFSTRIEPTTLVFDLSSSRASVKP